MRENVGTGSQKRRSTTERHGGKANMQTCKWQQWSDHPGSAARLIHRGPRLLLFVYFILLLQKHFYNLYYILFYYSFCHISVIIPNIIILL